MTKRPYITPEGYMDSLKMRLGEIPARESLAREKTGLWTRFTPYLALAGMFAVAIVAGHLLLNRPAPVVEDDLTWESLNYADLIPLTDPDAIFDEALEAESGPTEDDIIYYLINSNTSLEWIAQNLE